MARTLQEVVAAGDEDATVEIDHAAELMALVCFPHELDVPGAMWAYDIGGGRRPTTKSRKQRQDNPMPSYKELLPPMTGRGPVARALGMLDGSTTRLTLDTHVTVPPAPVAAPAAPHAVVWRGSVFVGARYVKHVRGLPQTPWYETVDGKRTRIQESSVQELVQAAVLRLMGSPACIFQSSGREDTDVRMLGEGRPFMLELFDAKHAFPTEAEFAAAAASVHEASGGRVSINGTFARIPREVASAKMHFDRENKSKTYAALVRLDRPWTDADRATLAAVKDMDITQRTPVRVLPRRALMDRTRVIHSCRVMEPGEFAVDRELAADGHEAYVAIESGAGTYIKEFVHSDLGRTEPSMCSLLGADADILLLDVLAVAD